MIYEINNLEDLDDIQREFILDDYCEGLREEGISEDEIEIYRDMFEFELYNE